MKLQLLLYLLGLLAVTASGLATQKAVIISYPNETPDSVISQAMDAVREAVGKKAAGSLVYMSLTMNVGWRCYA
jgi:hypothetical protein